MVTVLRGRGGWALVSRTLTIAMDSHDQQRVMPDHPLLPPGRIWGFPR